MNSLRGDTHKPVSYTHLDVYKRQIEVTMGRIYDYKVNYSQYLVLRQERRIQQQKAYDEQQKMIAETKEFIERFKGTYSKTLQVQSRVKMLEKLEILEVDEEDTSACLLYTSHGDLDSSGGDVVNKCPVVGYYDNSFPVIHEEVLQPLNRINVKVVGRLVK